MEKMVERKVNLDERYIGKEAREVKILWKGSEGGK
jgi:hypothetical protein